MKASEMKRAVTHAKNRADRRSTNQDVWYSAKKDTFYVVDQGGYVGAGVNDAEHVATVDSEDTLFLNKKYGVTDASI